MSQNVNININSYHFISIIFVKSLMYYHVSSSGSGYSIIAGARAAMIDSRITGHSDLPCTHCLGLWVLEEQSGVTASWLQFKFTNDTTYYYCPFICHLVISRDPMMVPPSVCRNLMKNIPNLGIFWQYEESSLHPCPECWPPGNPPFKVIHRIAWSHGSKKPRFWTKLGISGL